ncbi:nitric oxide synthase oxygenase [Micromonospora sp. NPDC007271]|uniref:nitric oxide synthase oxygenase n=1 Tax=Micromonospora sp. NPDC007271 TaxID=3154587 RepID=UPI0033CE2427
MAADRLYLPCSAGIPFPPRPEGRSIHGRNLMTAARHSIWVVPSPARQARLAAVPVTAEPGLDLAEVEDFIRQHHREQPQPMSVQQRLMEVRAQIGATGTYVHTAAELAFGARVAWRNSAACIGRLYWRSLTVIDARHLEDADEVAAACVAHVRAATNGGRIRPTITIFAPDRPGRRGPRIHNSQLIRYAGYRLGDGRVLGDPQNTELTDAALARGWQPPRPRGRFDVLPLIVTGGGGDTLVELPPDAVLEVPLRHPDIPGLVDLGLRWHALPVISNMRLRIGGIEYGAAPFNGWYMGTEIGARNLADRDRYDMLPQIARLLDLDMSDEATLWRDRALVELNRAVLWSFRRDGVTITDHHTESQRFLTHLKREEKAGRSCPADWSWIVPPMSGALTPVFHRYYDTANQLPNFLPPQGPMRCPFTTTKDSFSARPEQATLAPAVSLSAHRRASRNAPKDG